MEDIPRLPELAGESTCAEDLCRMLLDTGRRKMVYGLARVVDGALKKYRISVEVYEIEDR